MGLIAAAFRSCGRQRGIWLLFAGSLTFAVPAFSAEPRLLVLGDSLSAGYGLAHDQGFEVQLQEGVDLPFRCRPLLAGALADPEVEWFVYSEDDMRITRRNLNALVEVTGSGLLLAHEVCGFVRFEVRTEDGALSFPDMHADYRWKQREKRTNEKGEAEVFAEFTNVHQGCYVLNREQMRTVRDSGHFLVEKHGTERYGPLECGASDPWLQCGLRRLVCVSRFDDFLIRHLPNTYLHLGRTVPKRLGTLSEGSRGLLP